jgi:hypothetical protein
MVSAAADPGSSAMLPAISAGWTVPSTAVVAHRALHDDQVPTRADPPDLKAYVGRILATPLDEVVEALEALSRLWKFQYRVIVVDVVSTVDVRAQILPMPPYPFEQSH